MLEELDYSVIIDPKKMYCSNVANYENDRALGFRLMLLDKRFTNSIYYKEATLIFPKLENKDIRYNILYIFINIFHKETINKFFDLSAEITLFAVMKSGMYITLMAEQNTKVLIKHCFLYWIISNLSSELYPTDMKKQLTEINKLMETILAPDSYQGIIETLNENMTKLTSSITIN